MGPLIKAEGHRSRSLADPHPAHRGPGVQMHGTDQVSGGAPGPWIVSGSAARCSSHPRMAQQVAASCGVGNATWGTTYVGEARKVGVWVGVKFRRGRGGGSPEP